MSESERFESEPRSSMIRRDDLPKTVRVYVDIQSKLFTDKLDAVGADGYADLYKKYKAGEVTRAKLDEIGVFLKRIRRTAESGVAALEWDKYECLQTLEQEHPIYQVEMARGVYSDRPSRISSVGVVDNKFVLGTSDSTFASIWDLETNKRLTLSDIKAQKDSIGCLGKSRAVFIKQSGVISVVSLDTGNEVFNVEPESRGFIAGVAGVSDTKFIVDHYDFYVEWDLDTKKGREFGGFDNSHFALAMSSGSVCLIEYDLQTEQNRLVLKNFDTELVVKKQKEWMLPNEDIHYVDETVDGNIVYGNYEHIYSWNVTDNTRREIDIPDGLDANIRSVCALADGNVAVGYGLKGNVEIWDISGEEIKVVRVLKGHKDAVRSLSVMDDGRLVTGSEDGTVKIWGLR